MHLLKFVNALQRLSTLVMGCVSSSDHQSTPVTTVIPIVNTWSSRTTQIFTPNPKTTILIITSSLRGGDQINAEDDEERYSRQVYTLGSQAHKRIRSATVYLDGPPKAGLVFECAKNLALSGVKHLILVKNDEEGSELEANYFNPSLDDLGETYRRGARTEMRSLSEETYSDLEDEDLLMKYLCLLNPNVVVSSIDRLMLEDLLKNDQTKKSVVLCMDRPYSTQVLLNRLTRKFDMPFVAVETAGVFGRIFCDFGKHFLITDADGEIPINIPLDHLDLLTMESNLVAIHSIFGEKHDVSKGDLIRFHYRDGSLSNEKCMVMDIRSPYEFFARVTSPDESFDFNEFISNVNKRAAYFQRVKVPQVITFNALESIIEEAKTNRSLFSPCDFEKSVDDCRRTVSLSCFQTLPEFVKKEKRLPTRADINTFWGISQHIWKPLGSGKDGWAHCRSFLHGCAAKFAPIQSVFGALGAQEVMKAISGLYFPIHQFLLYDCDEVLFHQRETIAAESSRKHSCGLRYILGDTIVDRLQNEKVFLVGAGAIGCELLKNLAALGVGTQSNGRVILTDMDTIEKSNLSRQLLFRDGDVSKLKSLAAQEAAQRLNPFMNIESHANKVGPGGASPFGESFWSNEVDIVLNALDNVEARLYIDRLCVTYKIPLVDAGTLGQKGNVQVVVPHQSESYSSSVDPPETSIAMCTMKHFPYAISHTIQWGKNLFNELFFMRPNQVNGFLDSLSALTIKQLSEKRIREIADKNDIEINDELLSDLTVKTMSSETDIYVIREDALKWSKQLCFHLFYKASVDLLKQYPLDSLDDNREPFWTGTRRPPKPIAFDDSHGSEQEMINENLIQFIRSAARLRVETILGSSMPTGASSFTVEEAKRILKYSNANREPADETGQEQSKDTSSIAVKVQHTINGISAEPRRFTAIEFEKDNDLNGHVAFITATSNLRAIAYGIPTVDLMETRRIAGNIIPAMVTTTAFVSALSCVEMIKYVQRAELKYHRNAFINLAIPFFAFTVPLPPENLLELNGRSYTIWDQLIIKESKKAYDTGGLKMKSLLKKIMKLISGSPDTKKIASIFYGPFLLYTSFLHEGDDEVLNTSIWELIRKSCLPDDFDVENRRRGEDAILTFSVPFSDTIVDLTVIVEDTDSGEEIVLPTTRIKRFECR